MRVAIVWNHASRLLDCSFRFEQYVAGFRALGHEPVVVCVREFAEGFDAPLHLADKASAFCDADFWRDVNAEVAVIVTWHRMSTVLEAVRQAGTRPIAISDSDGRVGIRVFPAFALQRLSVYSDGWVERAKCFKYWLGRRVREQWKRSEEDDEAIRSTRASEIVALGHGEGIQNFRHFLNHHGEAELGAKLVEVPFTLGASFFSCPIPAAKDNRIVAVGRWGDPQKNAPLLVGAMEVFLAAHPRTEVVIFGAGGDAYFSPLKRRFPQLEYRGVASQEVVARTLAKSRSIVFSSRWEGCPHAATEALALGATLVGTPIPSLVSWTEDGRFGCVARRSKPRALARALALEMAAWDAGDRDGRAIADHWRPKLRPQEVCRRLLNVPAALTQL